jgi:hypothetical protein
MDVISLQKSLSALGENHQNNITLSSGLITSFALELTCNTKQPARAAELPGGINQSKRMAR